MKGQEIAITCVFGEEAVDIRAVILHSFLSMVKRELEKRDSLVEVVLSRGNEPVLPAHDKILAQIRKVPVLYQKSWIRDDTKQAFAINNI